MTEAVKNETKYKIFPIELALDSMKDSGYKDAAHAVAELIDNSIQAGEELDRQISVEVICLEKDSLINDRQSSYIDKIAIYDDASGMTKEVLELALAFGQGTRRGASAGMGKFGMGLPNASISQCDRVDVWSWRKEGEVHHTYLDLDEIAEQRYEELPATKKDSIPSEWLDKIKSKTKESGTLIVWSKLNRLKWKRHKAFFLNTEFIVGRMYRYFIKDEKCKIRMAAYTQSGFKLYSEYVKPNDPLYLMENTQAPDSFVVDGYMYFSKEPAFVEHAKKEIPVKFKGKQSFIKIKASYAKDGFRRKLEEHGLRAGDIPLGKQCAKNQGISVLRAGRELEMNRAFVNSYNPVERFWGMEVSFEPDLDEVFGVTNNKQSATAFSDLSLKDIADEEGEKSLTEMRTTLEEENDPRLIISDVTSAISKILSSMRAQLKEQTLNTQRVNKIEKGIDKAREAATRSTEKGQRTGLSDEKAKKLTREEKIQQLEDEIIKDCGVINAEDKQKILKDWLSDESKFIFSTAELRSSPAIFDVNMPAGKIKVTINSLHPAYEHFIRHLEEEDDISYTSLKLFFAAWARVEDEYCANDDSARSKFADLRMSWGQATKAMLEEINPS